MTREEMLKRLEQIEKDIYVCSLESTFADDAKSCAIHKAIQILSAEPREDAVSREALLALKQKFYDNAGYETEYVDVDDIKELPPVIPKPKIGHWIKEESIFGWDNKSYQCSVCGRSIHLDTKIEDLEDYPYCHCGAKMESEDKK